ncbi:MCE family protein [Mycobacteroides abscessus subsp. massiliense]|uniref:MlaD family protein n=1 Tax=Mycobacteroides abscessus TaxID=36809 RepID=UPI000F620E65|nr:MCE family protein [Mycobacteroides abscessus]RRE01020.1 MCE family protein [Mycobacteroides abscessus subsp. massiliense]
MSNSFDWDGRGPSDRRLAFVGLSLLVAVGAVLSLLLYKARGGFGDAMPVTLELGDVGDGLPVNSDVKFRGVLVGSVSHVVAARKGEPNVVHVKLKSALATDIPDTVTARVVPSNVFAVSSIQLVEHGNGAGTLRAGALIGEDRSMSTVLFQSALNKFRQLFQSIGRPEQPSRATGLLSTIGTATEGRGDRLLDAGQSLNRILDELDSFTGGGSSNRSTIEALGHTIDNLLRISPDLVDALQAAIEPMQLIAQERVALTSFLVGGTSTLGTVAEGLDNHSDRMINVTTQLAPVLGVLSDHANTFHSIVSHAQSVGDRFYNEAWQPDKNRFLVKGVLSLTPTRTYVRADCPRYGELSGPSCQTAPEVPTAPALGPALASRGLHPRIPENRPNLAPPRNSVMSPAEQEPASSAVPSAGSQPASFGGNVGPVGSQLEKSQLSRLIGEDANSSTELLLAPLARGATVRISTDAEGQQ